MWFLSNIFCIYLKPFVLKILAFVEEIFKWGLGLVVKTLAFVEEIVEWGLGLVFDALEFGTAVLELCFDCVMNKLFLQVMNCCENKPVNRVWVCSALTLTPCSEWVSLQCM